jgi:hypothetical protein
MGKKKSNLKKMPVHIPNQPLFNHSGWLFGTNVEGMKQINREHEFQKKLSLRKK